MQNLIDELEKFYEAYGDIPLSGHLLDMATAACYLLENKNGHERRDKHGSSGDFVASH